MGDIGNRGEKTTTGKKKLEGVMLVWKQKNWLGLENPIRRFPLPRCDGDFATSRRTSADPGDA
jgi:hypothetical protein